MSNGPRVIYRHAYEIPKPPTSTGPHGEYRDENELYWHRGGRERCAAPGCGLTYEAPVHWILADEPESILERSYRGEETMPVAPGFPAHWFVPSTTKECAFARCNLPERHPIHSVVGEDVTKEMAEIALRAVDGLNRHRFTTPAIRISEVNDLCDYGARCKRSRTDPLHDEAKR